VVRPVQEGVENAAGRVILRNAVSRIVTRGDRSIALVRAGKADILLDPDLEAGNMLAKQLIFMARAEAADIIAGAQVPIVLTSRADSARTRLASCAVAALLAKAKRQGVIGHKTGGH